MISFASYIHTVEKLKRVRLGSKRLDPRCERLKQHQHVRDGKSWSLQQKNMGMRREEEKREETDNERRKKVKDPESARTTRRQETERERERGDRSAKAYPGPCRGRENDDREGCGERMEERTA
jgi:hypothetical protein